MLIYLGTSWSGDFHLSVRQLIQTLFDHHSDQTVSHKLEIGSEKCEFINMSISKFMSFGKL